MNFYKKITKNFSVNCCGNIVFKGEMRYNICDFYLETIEKSCGERLNGFEELQKEFPEIKTQDDLPDEVLLSVSERGSNYFDEYLRYLYGQQKKIIAAKAQEQESSQTSVGSQNRYVGNGVSNTSLEFIKGLWS